jgi:hypothetical protein
MYFACSWVLTVKAIATTCNLQDEYRPNLKSQIYTVPSPLLRHTPDPSPRATSRPLILFAPVSPQPRRLPALSRIVVESTETVVCGPLA